MRYIFVVTYGRSGSTLLQGILNAIPGWWIAGENRHVFGHAFAAIQALKKANADAPLMHSTSTQSAWYGAERFDTDQFQAEMTATLRKIMEAVAPQGTKAIGFKEIRYFDMLWNAQEHDQLEPLLEFLLHSFPKAKMIFLSRNHEDVLKSGWWKDKEQAELDHAAKLLQRFDHLVHQFHVARPETTIEVTYEQVCGAAQGQLDFMFSFLGARPDMKDLEEVLKLPHSI